MDSDKKRVTKIRKRTGEIVDFNEEKIFNAIFKAVKAVGGSDKKRVEGLAKRVTEILNNEFGGIGIPTVEHIQDIVEKVLIEEGHAKVAKAYIIYRQDRAKIREDKRVILGGLEDDSNFSLNQLRIAEAKYLRRDDNGKVVETPNQMFKRVAKALAAPEYNYGKSEQEVKKTEEEFYDILKNMEFLPGGRTLANAGTEVNQLANCFVVPVKDSMEDIFEAVKDQALIQKTGGGTGFDFSELRPKGERVVKSNGVASGPVSFIGVFNAATDVIMQGNRRGANMGILRIDHPDILEFISIKDDLTKLNNFNLSVSITEEFMNAVLENRDYDLIHPSTGKAVKTLNARMVFDILITHAWRSGEPGVIFIDEINKHNPTPQLGKIAATNPCGEVPLLPYEACNLGSVNLSLMVSDEKIDWNKIRKVVRTGTRLLDNVIDAGTYPLPKIDKMVKSTRKIGMGVLGFADMLYQLNVSYDSEEGVKTAEEVMKFIEIEAHKMSEELAKEKSVFPAYKGSIYDGKEKLRNATLTSIAPTGTLSMLTETSGGVEPNFAICFIKNVLGGRQFIFTNKYFEKAAKERNVYTSELMHKIAEYGTIKGMEEIPEDIRRVFVISHDILPEWHIRMQAAFQKYVDNSISKTINFPNKATTKDVEDGYLLAYKLKCKGCTVYRDGSREGQVLNIKEVNAPKEQEKKKEEEKKKELFVSPVFTSSGNAPKPKSKAEIMSSKTCPDCGTKLKQQEGCVVCPSCGFSACSL